MISDEMRQKADNFNTYWNSLTEDEQFDQGWVMNKIRELASLGKYELLLRNRLAWEPFLKARGFEIERTDDPVWGCTPEYIVLVKWGHKQQEVQG